jgi:DNA-binding NarL/FixJ family response regulator
MTDSTTQARIALLSPREKQVLALVAEGNSNKTIAGQLGIACSTVGEYLKDAFAKLRVHDRTHAVVILFRAGVLH